MDRAKKVKKAKLDIYTSDGRINPDKVFGLVMEKMKDLTPEKFREIDSKPFQMTGVNRAKVRVIPAELAKTDSIVVKGKSTRKPAKAKTSKRKVG